MADHDSFQDRLRAIAEQLSQSVERLSEVDVEQLAEQYGVDMDRARTFAENAGQWLSDQFSGGEPMFEQRPTGDPDFADLADLGGDSDLGRHPGPAGDARCAEEPVRAGSAPGPHPLDRASDRQGVALAALDSGRWTVRPGSNQLTGGGEGAPPPAGAPDLVGELRARDWIASDGALTLVGRHALARWCRAADEPAPADPAA